MKSLPTSRIRNRPVLWKAIFLCATQPTRTPPVSSLHYSLRHFGLKYILLLASVTYTKIYFKSTIEEGRGLGMGKSF